MFLLGQDLRGVSSVSALAGLLAEATASGVAVVEALDFKLDPDLRWDYAVGNAAAIDAHWARRLEANPGFFNGPVMMMVHGSASDGVFCATFLRSDFKSYLYWRDEGFPEAHVRDAFGSGLVWSADGALMFARQSAGHINTGLTYMPGGFIDARDVDGDGGIDIIGSVERELAEELGPSAVALVREPGFQVTVNGNFQVSIGVAYRSALESVALRSEILAFLAQDTDPELADIVFLTQPVLAEDEVFAPHAALLAKALLPSNRSG